MVCEQNIDYFANPGAGSCFHEDCTTNIRMNGDINDVKPIALKLVKRGDVLASGDVIACVVRFPCLNDVKALVHLPGGMKVTPWHPVNINSELNMHHY